MKNFSEKKFSVKNFSEMIKILINKINGKIFPMIFFRDEKIFDQKIFGFSEMKKFSTKIFSTGIFLNFQEIFSSDADWIWAPTEQFNGPKSSKNDFRLKGAPPSPRTSRFGHFRKKSWCNTAPSLRWPTQRKKAPVKPVLKWKFYLPRQRFSGRLAMVLWLKIRIRAQTA